MIFDLIIAFKKAWGEINKDKIRSKNQLKDTKIFIKEWKERTEDIKKVEKILSKHWHYLPIVQRQDYIQKTYDLIHYGFDVEYHENGSRTYFGGYDNGLAKIYQLIHDYIVVQYNDMKHYYNKKNYEKVNSIYQTFIKYINEKLEQYHILEKDNEE